MQTALSLNVIELSFDYLTVTVMYVTVKHYLQELIPTVHSNASSENYYRKKLMKYIQYEGFIVGKKMLKYAPTKH